MSFGMAFGGLALYLYCYYGKCVTDSYLSFADCLYESNWICRPIAVQKLYILMIVHAQVPLSYHAYNIIDLNLETFTKVSYSLGSSFRLLDKK